MVNVDKLRGIMTEKHIGRTEISNALGISKSAVTARFKRGVFGSDEIDVLSELLCLTKEEAVAIFFADKVNH